MVTKNVQKGKVYLMEECTDKLHRTMQGTQQNLIYKSMHDWKKPDHKKGFSLYIKKHLTICGKKLCIYASRLM
jgi:hypothetical protein